MCPWEDGRNGTSVSDWERKAKALMKRQYDKTAKVKTFAAGEMVLVRG